MHDTAAYRSCGVEITICSIICTNVPDTPVVGICYTCNAVGMERVINTVVSHQHAKGHGKDKTIQSKGDGDAQTA
jgi:hypothetical protein